ncbi:hypothetical protein MMC25_003697 [Agyrium rufum]|nr:hypothetical protein [Agyrium rufum]
MPDVKLPAFKHTPVDEIAPIVDAVKATFQSQKTKDVEFRLKQLRKLYWAFTDNEAAICEALKLDVGKSTYEAYLAEIDFCRNDIIFLCNNLKKWVVDEKAPDISFPHWLVGPKIRKDPLGAVLIIGTYNFPFQLTLCPFFGAIAAGNTAIIKPSESAPNCAAVMQKMIEESLDPSCYKVVQGAIPETTALLDQQFDKIFYTGSAAVAKIISKRAAEHLTPVILELGGRNPAIVSKSADPRLAARRLLWGKLFNAGQVCVSHNVTLIDSSILPAFIKETKKALEEFFPNGAQKSPDYARIVNQRQWKRLKDLLDSTQGKIIWGGGSDEADRYLEPTVVQVSSPTDPLLQEETFGPIITILPVADLDEAIRTANQLHATPLAAYPFGNKADTDKVLRELRSGGASVNDSWYHITIQTLAFGGVGDSGQGSYRGRASFDAFTHRRSIVQTPNWMERLLDVRYMPYGNGDKLKQFQKMGVLKANFDREGNVKSSWVSAAFLLRTVVGGGLVAAGMGGFFWLARVRDADSVLSWKG